MNPGGWICPFYWLKAFFSGLQFDINCKIAISCMYQFGICNKFIDFDNFDSLNICKRLDGAYFDG